MKFSLALISQLFFSDTRIGQTSTINHPPMRNPSHPALTRNQTRIRHSTIRSAHRFSGRGVPGLYIQNQMEDASPYACRCGIIIPCAMHSGHTMHSAQRTQTRGQRENRVTAVYISVELTAYRARARNTPTSDRRRRINWSVFMP